LQQKEEETYQLQQAKQNLTFDLSQLSNQLMLLQGRSEGAGGDRLRRQIESEYEPILEEHKELKRDRTHYLRENEKLKLENERLEEAVAHLEQ
jgi:hypothetical protein